MGRDCDKNYNKSHFKQALFKKSWCKKKITIEHNFHNEQSQCSYLIVDEATGEAGVVDPAQPQPILDTAKAHVHPFVCFLDVMNACNTGPAHQRGADHAQPLGPCRRQRRDGQAGMLLRH